MVYYGPPALMLEYFRIPLAQRLYERLPQNSTQIEDAALAADMEERFREHDYYRRYCEVTE
jgi:hypothetical protein